MAKRKKSQYTVKKSDPEIPPSSSVQNETSVNVNVSQNVDSTVDDSSSREEVKALPFKSKTYEEKKLNKKKVWKGLKQIVSLEKSMTWLQEPVFYSNIDAPPSFKPAKKYSDLSGLVGNYTDPHTQLRFAFTEEYQTIQTLPSDIVAGYLTLRKAFNPVG